jgi:hypothetical protein
MGPSHEMAWPFLGWSSRSKSKKGPQQVFFVLRIFSVLSYLLRLKQTGWLNNVKGPFLATITNQRRSIIGY